jgi:hypothetical protein
VELVAACVAYNTCVGYHKNTRSRRPKIQAVLACFAADQKFVQEENVERSAETCAPAKADFGVCFVTCVSDTASMIR